MAGKLNWGILGCGRIAGNFAKGVAHSRTGTVVAAGSRSIEKANKFADENNIPRRHGSYEALLADKEVQAIYIATPHPMHAQWAIRAAEAGKHLLVEKPIGINAAEAMAILQAAADNDVFCMEAYMYRCSPQTAKLVELIRSGAIGEVRVIRAAFSFHAGFNPEARLFNNALAGGGILDVGGYCTSMARLIAGAATGKPFADPVEVKGCGHLGATGIDEWAVAAMKFPGDILAYVSTGISVNQDNAAQIFGTLGNILVPTAWIPAREGGQLKFQLKLNKEPSPQEIVVETDQWLYGLEADSVAENIERRQSPAMSWDDTLGNIRTMDAWRASFGHVYQAEQPENVQPVARRPLKVRTSRPPMKFAKIPGVDKPVSRLIMGCDNQQNMPHAAVMWDDFVEQGGNAFDTAYVYGGGRIEKLLGQWIRNRNIRGDIVVVVKGAHTPNCNPKALLSQFDESMDRLGIDRADVYMMHRDNLDVPVGEFVDAMNQLKSAGRVGAFGGSNWTMARFDEANAYARSHKLAGMGVVSNNFALARMVEAPWKGCLSCSDATWRPWLVSKQMPVLSWSSQARGFFTDRARPEDRSDADLARCWYCDENFRRKQRAAELAGKRGVPEISIALAWVLNQPFPTFSLIGPRTLAETRSSWQGLGVELSESEVRWLDLQE
jgi:predicted dehydrogenase/aryl-alcohol dehydrogenase-like predicted oxidoreductase